MKAPISVSIILALLAKDKIVARVTPFPLHSPQPPSPVRWPS